MKRTLSLILALLLVMTMSLGTAFAKPHNNEEDLKKSKAVTDTVKEKTNKPVNVQAEKEKKSHAQEQVNKAVQEAFKSYRTEKSNQDESHFTDVNQHWASKSIKDMAAVGIFKGYPDGTFKPDQQLTQAEALVLVMHISEEDTTVTAAVYGDQLTDIPAWARDDADKAEKKGIIKLNRFHSAKQASRAQTAVMIAKALELEPVDIDNMPFKDGILISKEDIGYILALYQEGIMTGNPNGNFNPNSAITRAEMASILERLLQNPENPENSEIVSVSLPETAIVEQGKSITLKATVKYADGSSNNQVSWSSSNTALATVENGVVTTSVDKTGTVTITATASRDESSKSASCTVTIVEPFIAGTLEDTGKVGSHDGKVFEEYVLEANATQISLAQDKVKSITLQKEGAAVISLSANTDNNLWFNVQHESGKYTLKVVDINNQGYTAVLNWTAPLAVNAIATGYSRQHEGNSYVEYKLGDLDLSDITCMYQIKPNGQVVELSDQTETNLWFQTNGQISGKYIFLINNNEIWYSSSISI